MTILAHEGALIAVALPDGMANVCGNPVRVLRGASRRTAFRGRAELLLLELFDRPVEHTIEHGGQVAVRDLVAEQRLNMMELIERLLADADMKVVAPTCDRRHLGWATAWLNWPRGQLNGGFLDRFGRALSDHLLRAY